MRKDFIDNSTHSLRDLFEVLARRLAKAVIQRDVWAHYSFPLMPVHFERHISGAVYDCRLPGT